MDDLMMICVCVCDRELLTYSQEPSAGHPTELVCVCVWMPWYCINFSELF